MNITDAHYKKTVHFSYQGNRLIFKTSQDLFSSFDIDTGTKRLLVSITTYIDTNYHSVLDLGCGYGSLGIALASANPRCSIHMVDTDALALEFAKENAHINSVSNINIYASLDYSMVHGNMHDLVVSNIPARIGRKAIAHILSAAQDHIKPTGVVAIVVVDAIAKHVQETLQTKAIKVLYHKVWNGHQVFHYQFTAKSAPSIYASMSCNLRLYIRNIFNYGIDNTSFQISTVYNLPEFDTPSYETDLLLQALKKVSLPKKHTDALVINPGQGYIPLILTSMYPLHRIALVSCNLLSLTITKHNLVNNCCSDCEISMYHQPHYKTDTKYHLITCVVPEKQNTEVYSMFITQISEQLIKSGQAILASNTTTIRRLHRHIQSHTALKIHSNLKKRSHCAILLTKHPK